jgi:hypothetical protein
LDFLKPPLRGARRIPGLGGAPTVIALPPKTLYFDESNFTGSNFLDVNQPIFVVSSSDIGDNEAESILKTAFPTHRASEFKFGNVWSDRKRKSLTKLAEQLGTLEARLYSYVIDKKFGVLIKALDFLVEPIVSAAGFDWCSRQRRGSIRMSLTQPLPTLKVV